MEKHILLIGFMGVGKSSVARKLSRQLEIPEADTDHLIEEREGMSISEIFEKKGELYFRDTETALLRELTRMEPMIISCGGGMAMRPENACLMKEAGTVVLLTALPQTILERVEHTHKRPLLEGHKNIKDIARLMQQRKARYEAAADITVATDFRGLDGICHEIETKVKEFQQI